MPKPHLMGRGPHLPPLQKVVQYPFEPGYVVFTMPVPRLLTAVVGDTVIARSARALYLYETAHLPVFYFPVADIRMDLMVPSPTETRCPYKGVARHHTLQLGGRTVEDILWRYPEPIAECPPIGDHAAFYWNKVDHWYEEAEEIFVHARDPFRRVDCLPSDRHVEIVLNGETIADTRRGVFLFETGLPTRYYIPREDVRPDVLRPSGTVSSCPYKGDARYHALEVGGRRYDDIAWYYPEPVHEGARIKGLICFANEFVDRILVDGEEQPRPMTAFSHGYS